MDNLKNKKRKFISIKKSLTGIEPFFTEEELKEMAIRPFIKQYTIEDPETSQEVLDRLENPKSSIKVENEIDAIAELKRGEELLKKLKPTE